MDVLGVLDPILPLGKFCVHELKHPRMLHIIQLFVDKKNNNVILPAHSAWHFQHIGFFPVL